MSEPSESNETHPRRYIIVGVGGTGSWLAEGLSRMAEFSNPGSALILIDGDSFEPKNVERQSTPEVTGNKAEVVAAHLAPKLQNTFIVPMAAFVVSDEADIEEEEEGDEESEEKVYKVRASDLLEEGDVLYTAVDNFKARADLLDAAIKLDNVDVFLCGNGDDLSGDIYHYRRRDGKDITINPKERFPELQDPPDRNPGEMSCQERAEIEGGTQLIAANLCVASLLLARTQHTIIEGRDLEATQIYFDLAPGKAVPFNRIAKTEEVETAAPEAVESATV